MAIDRRELRFTSLIGMADEADRLRTLGYVRAGVWDLPRVCDHLSRFMRMSITSFPSTAPWYMRLVARRVAMPLVLARGRMPAGMKTFASLEPLQPAAEADAVAAFRSICDDVEHFQGDFAAHPLFGALTADQWRQLHLIHGAHHLGFLVPKKPERKSASANR